MLLALDFRFFLPEVLLESSWLASGLLLIMGFIQIRGIQALYQDVTRRGYQPPPDAAPAPGPEPVPAPERVPEPVPPPPPVVRHYVRQTVLPGTIWVSRTGKAYHVYQDCQYVHEKAQVDNYQVCLTCQKKHKTRQ